MRRVWLTDAINFSLKRQQPHCKTPTRKPILPISKTSDYKVMERISEILRRLEAGVKLECEGRLVCLATEDRKSKFCVIWRLRIKSV